MKAPTTPQWALDAHSKLHIKKEPYQIACTRTAPSSSQDEELMLVDSVTDEQTTTTATTTTATTSFYVLNHQMDWEDADVPPLLVRNEYNLIYAYITTDKFTRESRLARPTAGLVVWGQPGIGKSAFLRYALARALSERQPVLFIYKQSQYVFFDDEGPHVINRDFYSNVEVISIKHPGVLVLVDSGHQLVTLPADISTLPIRIVQASSPHEARYREWIKQRKGNVWVMDPWTDEELMNAWSTMKQTPYSPIEHAQWAGNIPRTVLDKESLQVAPATVYQKQKSELLSIVRMTNSTALPNFLDAKQSPRENDSPGFHRFFVVSRDPSANHPASYREGPAAWAKVDCISPMIEDHLRAYFIQQDIRESLASASMFGSTPQVAGFVYEAAAIRLLARGRHPNLIHRWNGELFKSGGCEDFVLPSLSSPEIEVGVVIPPIGPATSSTLAFNFDQVYVPEAGYPTLHAVVATGSSMLLLQMTIAKVHKVKPAGITRLLNAVPVNLKSLDWHFLFVVPSPEVGKKLITKNLAEGVVFERKRVHFGYVVFALDGHGEELQACSDMLLSRLKGV